MRKVIGTLLLVFIFGILFALSAISYGVKETLVAWIVAILFAVVIVLAVCLIMS